MSVVRPGRLRRLRLVLAIVAAGAFAAFAALTFFAKVQTFQPLGLALTQVGQAWEVLELSSPQPELAPGDRIVLVGGAEVPHRETLAAALRAAPAADLLVLRGDELLGVRYERPALSVDVPYLILAASGTLYLLLGLYVLLRSRRSPSGLFYLWCLASAAVYLLTFVPGAPAARTTFLVEEVARLLVPPLTLHLFLVFPLPLVGDRRRWIAFLYLPSAVLASLQLDWALFGGGLLAGPPSAKALGLLDRFELAQLVGFALASLVALAWQASRRKGWEAARQLGWMAAGLAGGYLPFLALYLVPWTLGLDWPGWTVLAAVAPLALVPLTFSWALLRYRLWDLEILLRNAVSLTATVLLGTGAFSLLYLAISRGVPEELRLARSVLTFVAGLAIAGVLMPTERAVRRGLSRLQYRGTFEQRRALAALGRELLEERHLPRLCRRLVGRLREALEIEHVTLGLVGSDGCDLLAPVPGAPDHLPLAALPPGVGDLPVLHLEPDVLDGEATPLARLAAAGYRYAFPLGVRGRMVGLLLATGHGDAQPLNSEELRLVRSLLDSAALALENAQLMAELSAQLVEVGRQRHRSEQILESSPAAIVVIDREDRIADANGAFLRLLQTTATESVGRPLADVLPIRPLPTPADGLVEIGYCDPDGEERYVRLSVAPYAADPEALRVVVLHDVSERRQLEHALREKERLASLGMLAAGVAHEVNTPITGISSYAQLLLAETSPEDPRYDLLKKVERQTFRVSRIVTSLLDLARNKEREDQPVELGAVLDEAVEAVADQLAQTGATLVREGTGDRLLLGGGAGELQQVVVNLLVNAAEALEGVGGGTIRLAAEEGDGQARIVVRDDGPGIPPEALDKVFRPFFTTKTGSGGTGLGLAISYQIVRRHGGEISVESAPGQGATFTVALPTAPRRERA